MFNWSIDPEYNEPIPKRVQAIKCFDCKAFVTSKAAAIKNHRGHDVAYCDINGEREE